MKKVIAVIAVLSIVLIYTSTSFAGLKAYFPFTADATDATGNGWNGTVHGATLESPGYDFDGIDDYISINPGLFNNVSQGTFVADIYIDSVDYISTPIVSKGTAGLTNFMLAVDDSGNLVAHMGTSLYMSSNALIPLQTWTMVALNWDGSDWKMYINYSLDSTVSATETPLFSAANDVNIGRHNHQAGPFYFNGNIDDVRLYDHALSASEISSIVPEPISSILFITGGTLLAGRRYIKRKKTA